MHRAPILVVAFAVCLFAWSCESTQTTRTASTASHAFLKPESAVGLANLLEIAPGVYTGGAPELPQGYQSLAAMGVRSVLAVDAAKPNLDELHANSLISAHIPIEYSGVSDSQRLALVKALASLPRPIYIHCHHGTHRAPAAACVALLGTGEFDQELAEQTLAKAGTSPHYPGLFEAVRNATLHPDPASIDAELPEVAPTAPIAEAMAMIERRFERLEMVEANGWTVPETHPDLVPVAVAAHIEQSLRSLVETNESKELGAEFSKLMVLAASQAAQLETAITEGDSTLSSKALSRLDTTCSRCHMKFRNEFSF